MNRRIAIVDCFAALGYALAICFALICYSPLGIPALLARDIGGVLDDPLADKV